ncbi:pantothenate kinase [Fibrobacteres bacterium R8-0-B4]
MRDPASAITLAIDIGSTRTHIAAVDTVNLKCIDRIDSLNVDFDDEFAANVKKIAAAHPQIRRANVSSCVRSLAAKALDICADLRADPSIDGGDKLFETVDFTRPHPGLPVAFDYEEPGTLGTDRICDALACAAMCRGKTCIIIDVGTAVTVDYLLRGEIFAGIAILSGYSMLSEALHEKTDSLPLIDFGGDDYKAAVSVSLPSRSTEECIKAGIVYGMAGAIDRCVSSCRRKFGKGVIVGTGGGWEPIRPMIKHKTITIPDLTLIGAGIYR